MRAVRIALAGVFFLVGFGARAQTVVWSGTDAVAQVNTNWSDANNWLGGVPGRNTNVCFFDSGANGVIGGLDNIVDGNTAILSLDYGNTNGFHTTQINAGVTLTVSNAGAGNLVFVGTGTDNGINQTLYSTIAGTGFLKVVGTDAGSAFTVQQGSLNSGSHMATLDLSGLADFSLTAGRLLVGGAGGTVGSDNRPAATIYFAKTNVVELNGAAPALDAGDGPMNGGTEFIYLGQSNAIFVDSITIARQKCTATMAFNPTLVGSNPLLYLAGYSSSKVGALNIGDFSAQSTSGSTTSGTVNLIGGTVNAQVNTCFVGLGQTGNGAGTTTGVLNIGAGEFVVDVLNVGYVDAGTAVGKVAGTVNVTNGTLVVNSNVVLGFAPGAAAADSGTLTISNGTVLASNIVSGGGTSAIKMSGGLLAVSNILGTPTTPLSSLTLDNGAALEFWVANHETNAAFAGISGDGTGVIDVAALPRILGYPTQFPLIACPNGGASGVAFIMGTLPGTYEGYISNDNSSMIWLVITNGLAPPKSDVWTGTLNGDWDTSTLNWSNSGAAVTYSEGDLAVFNDSAKIAAVTISGARTPFSWTVSNNVLNYTFSGASGIGGPTGLVKSGGGSLTLSESGDSFSGGIAVEGGMVFLNQQAHAISGGLMIASGATARIGNGGLPSGPVDDDGALVFSQSTTDVVTNGISGSGLLTENGTGILELGGTNTYSGNTFIFAGTLALSGDGTFISSRNIVVSNGTFDVSSVSAPTLQNLDMTNGTIKVGAAVVDVAALNLGGSVNTIDVVTPPGPIFSYPTNITLLQSASAFPGDNFVLGTLPSASPAFNGTINQSNNSIVLTLTSGPLAVAQSTVSFAATNAGLVLNPAFPGLSYEKSEITGNLFVSTDTSLIRMFGQIAPAVLRIGGNSVDRTCWGGLSNTTPITASEVDAFAGFVHALPTNWHVIYGINMSVNNPTNCAAEAAYVASALGPSLLGFEIGNEPDLYHSNGIRPTNYTFAEFLAEWRGLAAAITNTVPGWAITNSGNGWTLTGPASAGSTTTYTTPFASDEEGVISLETEHYYRANGQSPSSTLALLLEPDTSLPGTITTLVKGANSAKLPLGFRMDECGSFYNGGAPNVSDAYGTALWAIDYMFTLAVNGAQGMNFHGGGDGTGYTPIADNGTEVVQARPEFYGLKMFSLVDEGSVLPATVTLSSNINFTAYGVRRTGGGVSAVLNNKETETAVEVTVNLGTNVTAAEMLELTGPDLSATNGYTIGGAEIEADGSWAGRVQAVMAASNGLVTITVPPISAILLNPAVTSTGTTITFDVSGGGLNLSWPSNYIGWLLQSNSLNIGVSDDWFTVAGSGETNSVLVPIGTNAGGVFYRMRHP